ncbi:MAG: flavin reductase family protein [Chloroflexi bacterium]|nr:flavin reductase family protein [Chloroflexota bacterium]
MSKVEIMREFAQRLLAGRPACLLTTRYRGQVNVMSVGWTSPISGEPPLLAIALHQGCYSHDLLKKSEECVLNIPSRSLAEQVMVCGMRSGAEGDKFKLAGLTADNARRVSAPWVAGCLAHIECAVVESIAPGDHTLFVVEVVGAWAEEEAFRENQWVCPADNPELQPLLHLGGTSFALLNNVLNIEPPAQAGQA